MDHGFAAKLETMLGSVTPAEIPKSDNDHPPDIAEPDLSIDDQCLMREDDIAGEDIAMPFPAAASSGVSSLPPAGPVSAVDLGAPPLPLLDDDALAAAEPNNSCNDDVVVFDELFEKFCGGAGSHQFT